MYHPDSNLTVLPYYTGSGVSILQGDDSKVRSRQSTARLSSWFSKGTDPSRLCPLPLFSWSGTLDSVLTHFHKLVFS